MIRSSNLLKTYSTYLHPMRSRVVYDSSKPFEMVFENSEEFEELMLSLHLIDKYLSTETGLTFETEYPELWQEKKQKIEMLFEFLTQRKISLAFVTRSNLRRQSQKRLTTNFENGDGVVSLFSGGLDSAAGAIELIKKAGCFAGNLGDITTILVDLAGFEPATSSVRLKRAPNCATGPRQVAKLYLSGRSLSSCPHIW